VGELTIYASEQCLGWEELDDVLSRLRKRLNGGTQITIKDPAEHENEFYERGLVVCPSILYGDDLIVVGVPTVEEIEKKLKEREGC